MVSFDRATLVAAAHVDPWKLHGRLAQGNPAQIDTMAAAFYKASGHLSDAHAATKSAQKYVKEGYRVNGGSPLDVSAIAKRTLHDPHIGADKTASIAKLLTGVATHLDAATDSSEKEIKTLNSRISSLSSKAAALAGTAETDSQVTNVLAQQQQLFNEAVTAVRNHGHTISTTITHYETTLHGALNSMADLGFIPPDAVDEGPGDIDPSKQNGTGDGRTTISAINNKNHVAGVKQYDQSTYYVNLLNRKMKADGRLTDAEYGYLWDYNNTIDGKLPQIDTWLQSGETRNAVQQVDGIDGNSPETVQGAVHQRGSIIADGVLNLTAAAEQNTDSGQTPYAHGPGGEQLGRGGVSGLPQDLQNMVYLHLGKQVPNDPSVAPDPDHPGTTLRAEWDPKTGQWVVAGQSTATGFSDLLSNYSSDDVKGGTGFSSAMGQAGVRWKQELNTIEHNTHAYYETEREAWGNSTQHNGQMQHARELADAGDFKGAAQYLHDAGWPDDLPPSAYWNQDGNDVSFDSNDTAASNALTVSAHNSTGAANVLLDAGDRRAILGLNWEHGDGAGKILVSGTAMSQDPNAASNQAAKAVMIDVGTDWKDFSNHIANHTGGLSASAAKQLGNALTTIGLQHIDSFGDDNPNHDSATSATLTVPGPDGKPIHINTVTLSNAEQKGFLEFESGLGDKNYSLIQTAGLERGSEYVAAAIRAGADPGSPEYQNAWRHASILNGHIGGAGNAQLIDASQSEAKDHQEAFVRAHQQYRNELAAYEHKSGILGGVSTVLDIGGTVAGLVPGGQGLSDGLGYVNQGLGYVTGAIDEPQNPILDDSHFENILNDMNHLYHGTSEAVGGLGGQAQGADWMAARAMQLAGREGDAPAGVYGADHTILLPTGYEGGHENGPNVDVEDQTRLENQAYPSRGFKPGADGTRYYSDMFDTDRNPTDDRFRYGYGPDDPSHPYGAGGSWGNQQTQTGILYGDNQRVDWDYGLTEDEKYRNGRGGSTLPHPILEDDNDKNGGGPRVSAYDYPR